MFGWVLKSVEELPGILPDCEGPLFSHIQHLILSQFWRSSFWPHQCLIFLWFWRSPSHWYPVSACSRSHSPALGVHSFSGVQRFNFSSSAQSPRRPSITHSPNSVSNDSFLVPEMEPIVPELCIDHLWTETVPNMRSDGFLGMRMGKQELKWKPSLFQCFFCSWSHLGVNSWACSLWCFWEMMLPKCLAPLQRTEHLE